MPIARFHLFEVVQDDDELGFGKALAEIAARDAKERAAKIGDRQAILLESAPGNKISAYLFSRIRMDGLPPKTNLSGQRVPLAFDDDEGLGEEIAIAYDSTLNVVAIQRNRFSLSLGNIAEYISSMCDGLSVAFRPLLSENALMRFGKQSILRKVHCRFAATTDLSFLNGGDTSEKKRIAMQQLLDAPYVDITFSVGHRKEGLSSWFSSFAEKCASAFHNDDAEILKLEVFGKADDDSETEYIDLLKEKLTYEDSVKMNGRMVDTGSLMSMAKRAIIVHSSMLAKRNVK